MKSRRTVAPLLLLAAFLFFGAGVALPFFSVTQLWIFRDAISVLSGLVDLAQSGEWFLFIIIFLFTLVFPLVKLGVLTAAWGIGPDDPSRADRMLRWASNLGKWSMLDVFVVAILVVALKSASLAEIELGPGIYLFTSSVLLTQLASHLLLRYLRHQAGSPAPPQSDS